MNQAPVTAIVRVAPGMDDNGIGYVVARDKVDTAIPGMVRHVPIPLYVDLDAIDELDVRGAVELWVYRDRDWANAERLRELVPVEPTPPKKDPEPPFAPRPITVTVRLPLPLEAMTALFNVIALHWPDAVIDTTPADGWHIDLTVRP